MFTLLGAAAFYSLSSDVLQSLMWQIEKIEGTNKVSICYNLFLLGVGGSHLNIDGFD